MRTTKTVQAAWMRMWFKSSLDTHIRSYVFGRSGSIRLHLLLLQRGSVVFLYN